MFAPVCDKVGWERGPWGPHGPLKPYRVAQQFEKMGMHRIPINMNKHITKTTLVEFNMRR